MMATASVCRNRVLAALFGLLVMVDAASARSIPASFADLAERLLPSVVNISTRQVEKRTGSDGPETPPGPPGSALEELFRQFMERGRPQNRPPTTSLGSGFIIDPQGYIVTNNHVIEEADRITVTLHDETRMEARVVGRDPKTDLALLKVNPETPLNAVAFGDSSMLRVGDWVLAIGNPFGLGGTVTTGIVSARQRDINSGPYDDFIQTDAAINGGNSGGPMFDLDGNVVGINTAIFTPSGLSVGIGFAIPSNLAGPIIKQLRQFGKARRGWLGVQIQDVTDEIARSLELARAEGALVAAVTEDSAAARAGIEVGDVILEFDGRSIRRMRHLPRIVAETEVGKTVEVVIWRQGRRQAVSASLGELPQEDPMARAAVPDAEEEAAVALHVPEVGVTLSKITQPLRTQFSLGDTVEGVVVTEVSPGSAAERKDLRPGMVIRKVGPQQRTVDSPRTVVEQVRRAREAGQSTILMLLEVDGSPRFVGLDIDSG